MRFSVCVIDDGIPASKVDGIRDTELLNTSNLLHLLQHENQWTDGVIMNLVRTLIQQTEQDGSPRWEVYGFTNPTFYINTLEEGLFRSDIVIFDWDYPATPNSSSESLLKEILESSFSLVFVFSGADKKEEIYEVFSKSEFKEYGNRLEYLDKAVDGEDQTNALIAKADESDSSNFSFRFASTLRKLTLQVMDRTLSELGRATLSDMKNYLMLEEVGSKRDLVDFIAERFRSGLINCDIPDIEPHEIGTDNTQATDDDLIRKLWSYRLYMPIDSTAEAGDEILRRGDVVSCSDGFFLVFSADCDLRRFWNKNFGTVNVLPLHQLDKSDSALADMLRFCVRPGEFRKTPPGSLTGNFGTLAEGPFILPFLKIDETYTNFVALPKELTGRKIEIPDEVKELPSLREKKNSHIKYSWWDDSHKVCSVAEPFLSGTIAHTFNVIGGHGVPDYDPIMISILTKVLEDFLPASE